ncbi:MAG TPA: hypothetical protein VG712_03830 [Gemmatimonadales bacterium]|nr:hypothetical protein [Gemmatimonadales bacterium]
MTEHVNDGGRSGPLLDRLGQLIQFGHEASEYLWQVPDDRVVRAKVGELLEQIRAEAAAQGRREMPAICDTLGPAVNAAPTPQSVEILQDGFERLHKLWLTTRSGLV